MNTHVSAEAVLVVVFCDDKDDIVVALVLSEALYVRVAVARFDSANNKDRCHQIQLFYDLKFCQKKQKKFILPQPRTNVYTSIYQVLLRKKLICKTENPRIIV